MKMFEIKNLSKKFGSEYALHNITMDIGKGLNFVIGSSGSGKTSLLKLISGMEQDFEGEAFFCRQSIKELSHKERSYFYNHVFGFIWQDFNLLEDLTVLENVMLPQYLKQGQREKSAMKILHELKISEFAHQKAGKLSGGQKQRVAIARELMKNPKVIFADEPTSALDDASSKITMDILRDISKSTTVIVVTHDTSLIHKEDKIYELDKGELIYGASVEEDKYKKVELNKPHKLSLSNSRKMAVRNTKSKVGRFIVSAFSLLIAATLLLVTASGSIEDSGQAVFDQLYGTYGESILDISVVDSFTSAGGTGGNEGADEPSADVIQKIGGLYDKYKGDDRVEHIVFSQAFNNIKVRSDGMEYPIENSGNVPSVNKLVAGGMPMGMGNEVVVPQSLIKNMGITEKDAIGKMLDFDASIYNWDSGEPVPVMVGITAKIVGVADSTVKYGTEGEMQEFSVDDSFFFSKPALDEMGAQAGINTNEIDFTIRAKSPAHMIAIKDELNGEGIVPLGRFELVEDMVRLNNQTTEQSNSAIFAISFLAIVMVVTVSMITALTRKHEYGIYKVCGYNMAHMGVMAVSEFLIASAVGGMLFLCASPLINLITMGFWDVNILKGKLLIVGVLFVVAMAVLSSMVAGIVSTRVKISDALKTGDR